MSASSDQQPLLVVGAGISGVTAALEAAEAGREVVLVEREAAVGGRVLRNHNYFPKLCPPSCGMEINTKRIEKNPRIRVMTSTTVAGTKKVDKGLSVELKTAPAYVNDKCTACGDCSKVCPATVKDPYNLELCDAPAIRLPHIHAWPHRYVLDRHACPEGCKKCVEACKFGAIDLDAKEKTEKLTVGAMVAATGWQPYPMENLVELGGGKLDDVIANVHMERLVAKTGPTEGKILCPSNSEPPKSVAFVQCAGSRDTAHLPYCSAVCCLASLKQAIYVREQLPECEVTMYYIDRRTPGRNEDMLTNVAAMDGVKLVKGKVGKIDKAGGKLKMKVEDVESGKLIDATADLIVLATGMMSNLRDDDSLGVKKDDDGFGLDDFGGKVVVAGVARRPEDVAASVRDATAAAAKAIAAAGRGA